MNKQNYKEVSTIGRWGRMHGRYLKDNHPVRYTVLLLSGKLNGYLVEFDQQAKKQLELIVQQMAEREDVTEELKASDQMEWVRRMNNIRNRAEEVIKTTLIYPQDVAHARIYDRVLEMCVPVSCFGTSIRKDTAQEKLNNLKSLIG